MYSTVGARHYVARVCQRQRRLVLSYRHPYIKTTNGRPWVEKATSICSFLIDYQNSFTVRRSSKIVIKSSLKIQLHLTCTYATKLLVKYLTPFLVHRDQWPAFWRHSVYMTEQLMVAISMNSVPCVFDYAALLPSWTTAWRHDCAGEIGRKMKICDVTVERSGKGGGWVGHVMWVGACRSWTRFVDTTSYRSVVVVIAWETCLIDSLLRTGEEATAPRHVLNAKTEVLPKMSSGCQYWDSGTADTGNVFDSFSSLTRGRETARRSLQLKSCQLLYERKQIACQHEEHFQQPPVFSRLPA